MIIPLNELARLTCLKCEIRSPKSDPANENRTRVIDCPCDQEPKSPDDPGLQILGDLADSCVVETRTLHATRVYHRRV